MNRLLPRTVKGREVLVCRVAAVILGAFYGVIVYLVPLMILVPVLTALAMGVVVGVFFVIPEWIANGDDE